jgi:hypothetical protein
MTFYYCTTSCGHNFITGIKKEVGQIGECDKCEDYGDITIVKVEEIGVEEI